MAHLWLTAFPWRRATEPATLEFSDGSVEKFLTIDGGSAPTTTFYSWNIGPSTADPVLLPVPRTLRDQGINVTAQFTSNNLVIGIDTPADPGSNTSGTVTLQHPTNSDIQIYVYVTYIAPSSGPGGPGELGNEI